MGARTKPADDITRDEMLRYYRQHQAEFTKPARASWEELMVSFEKHPKEAGTPTPLFAGWAMKCSSPAGRLPTWGTGRFRRGDRQRWRTPQLDLPRKPGACKALDGCAVQPARREAQPGHPHRQRLSHHPGHGTRGRCADALPSVRQADIKKKIVEQRSKKQTEEYLAELIAKTPVWTIFDDKADVPRMAEPPRGEIRR